MLTFGYNQGLPDGTTVAWGARAILNSGTVDLVHDRQSTIGTGPELDELLALLNSGVNARWIARVKELCDGLEMRGGKAEHFELYVDQDVTVVANTKASHGYLYIAAYLTPRTAAKPM